MSGMKRGTASLDGDQTLLSHARSYGTPGGMSGRAHRLVGALVLSFVLVWAFACAPSDSAEVPEDASEIATGTAGATEPPPPPEQTAARSRIEFSGEGFTADYDAWNCEGLEGEWKMRGEIDLPEYGKITGDASFTMPPRPESGQWDSLPFDYTMSGTLDAEDAIIDITYEFEDIVFTIIETGDGPTLGDSRGMVKGTVRVTTPEMSFVVSETYAGFVLVPALIRYERHPECD